MEKCALSELSWISHSSPGGQQKIEHSPSAQDPAVTTDLQNIFSGVAAGSPEIGREDVVYFPFGVVDFSVEHSAGNESIRWHRARENPDENRPRVGTGQADHGESSFTDWGGDGGNGVFEGHRRRRGRGREIKPQISQMTQ